MSETFTRRAARATFLFGILPLGGLVLVYVFVHFLLADPTPLFPLPRTEEEVIEAELLAIMQGNDSRKKARLTLRICQACRGEEVAALERIAKRPDIDEATRALAYQMGVDVVANVNLVSDEMWQCQRRCKFTRALLTDPRGSRFLTPFHVIKLCGAYGGKVERDRLIQTINQGPDGFKRIALQSLVELRSLPDTPFLVSLVAGNDRSDRALALEWLGLSFYSKRTFDRLFEVYRQSDRLDLRLAIIRFLGQNQVPDGLRFLEALGAEETGVERLAARRWLRHGRRRLAQSEEASIAKVARSVVLDANRPSSVFRDFFGVDAPPESVALEDWLEGRVPICDRPLAIRRIGEYFLANRELASARFSALVVLRVRERDRELYELARRMIEEGRAPETRYCGAVQLAEMGCFDGVPTLIALAGYTWDHDLDRHREIGALALMSLRQITGENFLDDTKAWQDWWQAPGRVALAEWTFSFEECN